MSDPEDIPGRRKPPRAEPLQPDRPASGNEAEPDSGDGGGDSTSAEQQKTQSDRALKNVRESYG